MCVSSFFPFKEDDDTKMIEFFGVKYTAKYACVCELENLY